MGDKMVNNFYGNINNVTIKQKETHKVETEIDYNQIVSILEPLLKQFHDNQLKLTDDEVFLQKKLVQLEEGLKEKKPQKIIDQFVTMIKAVATSCTSSLLAQGTLNLIKKIQF